MDLRVLRYFVSVATEGSFSKAALKLRESSQSWTESYPSMDYRHGPIAIASPHSLVWILGTPPPGLINQIEATGATTISTGADPLVDLVSIHRLALDLARARGLDPDRPVLRGSAQNPDVFFQAREASNPFHAAVPGIVERTLEGWIHS